MEGLISHLSQFNCAGVEIADSGSLSNASGSQFAAGTLVSSCVSGGLLESAEFRFCGCVILKSFLFAARLFKEDASCGTWYRISCEGFFSALR